MSQYSVLNTEWGQVSKQQYIIDIWFTINRASIDAFYPHLGIERKYIQSNTVENTKPREQRLLRSLT